ncbi:MAG: DUF2065 domain-containing protein [Pseudomonadota bacterium]
MGYVLLAFGLVMILEGLVYVLAPSLVEHLLEAMRAMPLDARRMFGLVIVLAGVCCLIGAKALGVLS